MHLIYIDDSKDERLCVFSALALPIDQWHKNFRLVKDFRHELKREYGLWVHKELHAWKFVSGRGRPSDKIITKGLRASIFKKTLEVVTRLPGASSFNVVFPRKHDELAFECMLNQINRTFKAWGSYGVLVCDEGKEAIYTRLVRRMYIYNPIPTKFDDVLNSRKDMPLERIVEDPFFKNSSQSYFIQLVDFCAYSLLRRERPIPSKSKYGIHQAFDILKPILVNEANQKDPEGIIRP